MPKWRFRTEDGAWEVTAPDEQTAIRTFNEQRGQARPEMRSYSETPRDYVFRGIKSVVGPELGGLSEKTGLIDPTAHPTWESIARGVAEVITGSKGVGREHPSLSDVSPLSPIFGVPEAERAFERGDIVEGTLDALSAIPAAGALAPVGRRAFVNLTPNQTARYALLQRAERQDVAVPRFVASRSRGVKGVAGATKELPFIGDPLAKSFGKMGEDIGEATSRLSQSVSPASDAQSAGRTSGDAMLQWIRGGSRVEMGTEYDALENLIDVRQRVRLPQTAAAARRIRALGRISATDDAGRAVALVENALSRRTGLQWNGIKGLRSAVGERLAGRIDDRTITQQYLEMLYSALTADLRNATREAAVMPGVAYISDAARQQIRDNALQAFDNATATAREVFARRARLRELIGREGTARPALVFDRITKLAGTSGQADLTRLQEVRDILGPEAWNEVSAAMIARMGLNAKGEFVPSAFTTAYGSRQISDGGKAILFDRQTRAALDDIEALSREWTENLKFGNPSGTGRTVAIASLLASWWAHPLFAVSESVSGAGMAYLLSRPATAKGVRDMVRAIVAMQANPTAMATAAVGQAIGDLDRVIKDEFGGAGQAARHAIPEPQDRKQRRQGMWYSTPKGVYQYIGGAQ